MSNKSILLVDDEEIIVKTMRDDLQCEGYRVDVALDGKEGLALFATHRHSLVIVDLVMAEMGGIELVEKIKDVDSQTKVVILTGYGTRDSAIDSLRLGVSDFLIKPYERKELLIKIAQLLEDAVADEASPKVDGALKAWGLSEREIEVSKLMLVGTTKEEIAFKLFISKLTVDTHIKNIYKKMKINSLAKFIGKLSPYQH
ncbi:MAG: response regulator transcription factor [Nitrospina sp.]|jgi:DNA-binding NarL/FixJ family response regulator|nr:response regulator transcription factor [Nitrospina sp.]MBT3416267.1 response regulator transcription factor [Nitrospina sp.]MBT3857021.1 response regulator transcription factor [Nitrospina sp.]MBT4105028.1 response regulator transcription factor [Nitrospina sp.]MBT4388572.1 response regulator transcription factor [Nitrospina sp.]